MRRSDCSEALVPDRRFFAQHDRRRHRLRKPLASERCPRRDVEELRNLPTGYQTYVLVRRVGPYVRLKRFVALQGAFDTEPTEAFCAALWSRLSTPWLDGVERRIASVDVPPEPGLD